MNQILSDFRSPTMANRGMFRCWFPDAGADLDRMEAHVRRVYEAGFGGMEIAMVPQFADFDAHEYGWATPRWKEILRRILQTAVQLPGFTLDLTITAHWPPSLNTIDPNDEAAQKELHTTITKITSGGTLDLPLPPTRTCDDDAGDAARFIFTDTFLRAVTGRIVGRRGNKYVLAADSLRDVTAYVTRLDRTTPAGIAADETKFGSKPRLADTQYYHAIDLDAAGIPAAQAGDWQEGDWLLFAFYVRGTGQTLSGRSMEMFHLQLPMADKMYAADYYSTQGTDAIIDVWEKQILDDAEIRALLNRLKGAIFEDSIELSCATIPWTCDFLPQFAALRGYDATPFLPILQSMKGAKAQFVTDRGIEKLLADDFYTTLNELYLQHHVRRLMDWTKTFGYSYRAQSYGGDVNTAEASVVLDIAEGESLGFGSMREYFRNISGGVHMTGRTFVSDEVLADLMSGYCLDWKGATATLNSNWAAGVNRMVIHGMSYETEVSGKYSQWPGWHAFQNSFADPWGDRMPYWPQIHALSGFIARTQAVLQGGIPKVDLAIYKGQRAYGWGYTRLLDFGYSFDVISNSHLQLPQTVVEHGLLCPTGPAYQALLMVDQELLPLASARALLKLAQAGLPLLFVGKLPARANGAFTPDEAVQELLEMLLELENVHVCADLEDALALLGRLGLQPRAAYADCPLEPVCRQDDNGTYYFLYNHGEPGEFSVTLQGTGVPVQLNPWTGAETAINWIPGEAGGVQVTVFLAEGDTTIVALLQKADEPEARCFAPAIELTDFDTTLESWGPDPTADIPTQSQKTRLPLGIQPLGCWETLPATAEDLQHLGVDSLCHVSGRGLYQTEVTLPACDGAVLTLATGDCMIVGGTVNGLPLPPVNQRSGEVDLKGLVQPGKNRLELILATTLINRLRIAHPLFDGTAKIPGPPAAGPAPGGETGPGGPPAGDAAFAFQPDDTYELPGAPNDMPTPRTGDFHYGLLSATLRPYQIAKPL